MICKTCICHTEMKPEKVYGKDYIWCYYWETARKWNKECPHIRSVCGDCKKGEEGFCVKLTKRECKQMYQEEWCKKLIMRLGKYKEIESDIEILEVQLERNILPKNKLVANYGDVVQEGTGLGVMSEDEVKLQELQWEKRLLDAALNILEKMHRDIIKLRYIEKVDDWHIMDIYIPANYTDKYKRPLSISRGTYYSKKADAIKRIAKQLGYIAKLD